MPKIAVTASAAVSRTVQVVAPEQAPLQPVKVLLAAGVSLSVTWVFCGKLAEQVVGQLIPAGVLVTVPAPAPAMVTVTGIVEPAGMGSTTPRQPASARVNAADSNVTQDVYRNFISEPLPHR
jgi:hypothetical protein